jgi:hypothetical protein
VLDRAPTSKELFLSFWEWLAVEITAGGGTSLSSDGLVFFVLLARLGRSFTTAERFSRRHNLQREFTKWEHKTTIKITEIYSVWQKIIKHIATDISDNSIVYCCLEKKPIA